MIKKSRRIVAEDVIDDEIVDDTIVDDEVDVTVAPEATELLFEAEDVAELVAEIVGSDVEVSVNDDNTVDFAIGEDVFTVSAEGDEELLEASKKVVKKGIDASRAAHLRKSVAASAKRSGVPARKATRRVR